jgi:DNA-binding transcriptional MerR regulator
MGEISFPIEIPKGTVLKASEVCDLVKVQPYVLRSWEGEFPGLGVVKTAGGPRVYRRADIEQVLRIKHLLLVEGLTLAGARRRLEEESAPQSLDTLESETRNRLDEIRRGLQSILELLSPPASDATPEEFALQPPVEPDAAGSIVAQPPATLPIAQRSEKSKAARVSTDPAADEAAQEWSLSDPSRSNRAPLPEPPRSRSAAAPNAARETQSGRGRQTELRRKDGASARPAAKRKR